STLQEGDAKKRPAREIERPAPLFGGEARGFCRDFDRGEVDPRHGERPRWIDLRERFSLSLAESCAQPRMPSDDRRQCSDERSETQRPVESEPKADVVSRRPGLQPIEKPEALLRERQLAFVLLTRRFSLERRRLRTARERVDPLRDRRDRGAREKISEG